MYVFVVNGQKTEISASGLRCDTIASVTMTMKFNQVDFFRNVSHTHSMESCTNKEVVVLYWKTLLIEKKPCDNDGSVKPDAVETEHGKD